MNGKDYNEVVRLILREDTRYDARAYFFIREALDYTLKRIKAEKGGKGHRHISGAELSEGVRDFALEQYGPMAATLFRLWGIEGTRDFGQIVYTLVEYNVFGTQKGDSIDDFNEVYDFFEVFEKPFLPQRVLASREANGGLDLSAEESNDV